MAASGLVTQPFSLSFTGRSPWGSLGATLPTGCCILTGPCVPEAIAPLQRIAISDGPLNQLMPGWCLTSPALSHREG